MTWPPDDPPGPDLGTDRETGRANDLVVSALVVDCRDPAAVALFWSSLLGGETVAFDEFGVVALRAPGVTFDFVAVDDHKATKNRWHLDLATSEPEAMIGLAVELGGRRAPDVGRSDRFTVMRDVEGNEFCILHYPVDGPWIPPTDVE